ncbi:MAG: AMP-binding protein [Acidobacteria bacterium]|nr:AMP-binding protein [Acidobacteriota bacterium]
MPGSAREGELPFENLSWPPTKEQIVRVHSEGKRRAFERAKRSSFYKGRLDHVDPDRLDDPAEWAKIPILHKEELREIPADRFHDLFCIQPDTAAVEYWRSGGATGRPLFYPRSAVDVAVAIEAWRRLWLAAGCTAEDKAHVSCPLGIHPNGQLYARAGEALGIGTLWAGSGSNTPSALQLELIKTLKPTVWLGMASYGLQLASLAERDGFDLARGTVKKLLCSAEPLSESKREKLERMWGAEVYDQFGCTEGSAMGSESDAHDGMHVWTDLFFVEVVHGETGQPLAYDQPGELVMTPMFGNTITPFLRWNMGDIGTLGERGATTGPLSVFPVFRHTARTSGFFKVRGMNIHHSEFEDFIHRNDAVADFRLEVQDSATGDRLVLQIEFRRGADRNEEVRKIQSAIKETFEVTPEIEVLEIGTLAQLFIQDVKAARFVDRRS